MFFFRKVVFIYILVFLLSYTLVGQIESKGLPFISNFERNDYKAGTQNWSISQSQTGELFFANNSGLLRYDGIHWDLYPVPNNSVVRSIYIDSLDRVYVGAFEEFGYFYLDSAGFYIYNSLSSSIIDNSPLGDIWKIYNYNGAIIFQSFTSLFLYQNGKLNIIEQDQNFQYSFKVANDIYIIENDRGLLKLDGQKLYSIYDNSIVDIAGEIVAIFERENSELCIIGSKGLFTFEGNELKTWVKPINDELKNAQIYSAAIIDSSKLVIGTVQKGIYIIDKQGNLLRHIDKEHGLLNNTILSIFVDKANDLWLGLDNGISRVEISSPFTSFSEAIGIMGTGYTSAKFNEKLYLGTNQGLFVYDPNTTRNEKAKFIEGTEGQVWSLFEYKGSLFCGQHNGIYLINENKAVKISDELGNWMFLPLKNDSSKLLVGGYTGLSILTQNAKGKWNYSHKIKGFSESCRIMSFDKYNNLWMSHGYKGVYKIKLNAELDSVEHFDFYNSENGFPSNFAINVFKLENRILFSTEKGIYEYDSINQNFKSSIKYNNLFKKTLAYSPHVDSKENIWFVHSSQFAFLKKEQDKYVMNTNIFNKIEGTLVAGFEHFNVIDSQNTLIGNEHGYICYHKNTNNPIKRNFITVFEQIKLVSTTDSIIYGSVRAQKNNIPKIAYRNNSAYFSFAAPFFENADKTEYYTFLYGYDISWSNGQHRTHKEYTNLSSGEYTFNVKSKNVYGDESPVTSFTFIIKKPWYRTYFAYAIYILFSVFLAFIAARIIDLRLEKEKEILAQKQADELNKQQEEHNRMAIMAEQEIIKLKNAMLQTEIEKKNLDYDLKKKELATVALKNTHKNEILLKVKERLIELESHIDQKSFKQIKQLIKSIDAEMRLDQDWDLFKKHFEEVHGDFFKRLKQKYTDLTPKDLKLCAYLRINLATKEIAPLMNISVRGVEIGRYRLRKKLGIDSDKNLFDFMLQI